MGPRSPRATLREMLRLAFAFALLAASLVRPSEEARPEGSLQESIPEFVGTIPNVTVPLGRNVVIPCVVKNLGQFKVGWIKVETQTILSMGSKVVSDATRISIIHDEYRMWKLHIRQTKVEDKGCYMCQINTSKLKSQIGCLDVFIPPDIVNNGSSHDLIVKEHDNVTLVCEARGYPSPEIEWSREDLRPILLNGKETLRFKGASLVFADVSRRDMGAYLCIASNDVPPAVSKRVQLSVAFAPAVFPEDPERGASLGAFAVLTCRGEGHPRPSVSWARNNSRIEETSEKYAVAEKASGATSVISELTISNLVHSDFGYYECRTNNSEGRNSSRILVYEIITTTIMTTTTTTVRVTTTIASTGTASTSWAAPSVESPASFPSLMTTEAVALATIRKESLLERKGQDLSTFSTRTRTTSGSQLETRNSYDWYRVQFITSSAWALPLPPKLAATAALNLCFALRRR